MRLTVVSNPAASSSIAVAVSSSSVSLPSALVGVHERREDVVAGVGAQVREVALHPPLQRAQPPLGAAELAVSESPASSERAASAPQARNWRLIATGAPSISAMTVAGSRLAYSVIRSASRRPSSPVSSSSAISSVRLRSAATARAVNARETSLR